ALNEKFNIHWKLATARLHQRFYSFEMHVHLPFVIDGATSIQIAVTFCGLEGRSLPFIERIRRLHIVMSVAKHSRLSCSMQPVSIDQWMARGLDDLNILNADALEFVGDELRRALHVVLVLRKRADAGNA